MKTILNTQVLINDDKLAEIFSCEVPTENDSMFLSHWLIFNIYSFYKYE